MRSSFVSSSSVTEALRYSMMRKQAELVKAQKEAEGTVADVGLALGKRTTEVVNFNRDLDRLNAIVDTNALVTARLTTTQKAIGQLGEAADLFMSALTAASTGGSSDNVTRTSAQTALGALSSVLNVSVNGEHLFAGVNTDVKPFNDFSDPASASKVAFDAAFVDFFGFAQDAPAASAITATQMDGFLDVVEADVMGSGWTADWSNASDQNITSRIALNETSATSISGNEKGFRRMALAAAAVSDLFSSNLSEAGKAKLVDRSVALVGQAVGDLADLQGRTGVLEKRVTDASTRVKTQADLFEKHILDLQGVDPYEAATRVSDLLSQIETSYALTARIQQLSLLNYLS